MKRSTSMHQAAASLAALFACSLLAGCDHQSPTDMSDKDTGALPMMQSSTSKDSAASPPSTEVGASASTETNVPMADSMVNQRVEQALSQADSLKGQVIDVATAAGIVTLSGRVNSPEDRAQAEALVQKINGVKSVTNMLQVAHQS